ncbi:hypothetical protein DFH06DRAFT_1406107 [Mycena polygramma]|nr:hypothetical protein DFH06DRAFT_1406107 [Mycena polygramma]
MLRRQRSLAALLTGTASAPSSALNSPNDDVVPPMPNSGVYSKAVNGHGHENAKGGGLIRRVSNIFRSGASGNASASAREKNEAAHRAAASKSTPDVRLAPVSSTSPTSSRPSGGGAKLVKRPSVKYAKEKEREKEKEKTARVGAALSSSPSTTSGAGIVRSRTKSISMSLKGLSRTTRGVSSPHGISSSSQGHSSRAGSALSYSKSYSAASRSSRANSVSSSNEGTEDEADIRRPSGLGEAAPSLLLPDEDGDGDGHRYAEGEGDGERTPTPGVPVSFAQKQKQTQLGAGYGSDSAYASSLSASEDCGESGDEDDIRQPAGLGKAASSLSLPLNSLAASSSSTGEGGAREREAREKAKARDARRRTLSTPTKHKLSVLHELLGLPPPVALPSSSSPHSSSSLPSHSFTSHSSTSHSSPSHSPSLHSHSPSSRARHTPPPLPSSSSPSSPSSRAAHPEVHTAYLPLPAPLWRLVFAHLSLADAARAARVCRVLGEVGRGRVWREVDLRGFVGASGSGAGAGAVEGTERGRGGGGEPGEQGGGADEEDDTIRVRLAGAHSDAEARRNWKRKRSLARALRTPHLAARVEAVVCAGWPPWVFSAGAEEEEGGEQIHLPALRSLTIFPPAAEDASSPPASRQTENGTTSTHPPRIDTSGLSSTSQTRRPDMEINAPALLTFLRAHPTLERLAVVGCADVDAEPEQGASSREGKGTEDNAEKVKAETQPFLPRLTHLHAPPSLAVRLLERIARAPFASPLPPLPPALTTSNSAASATSIADELGKTAVVAGTSARASPTPSTSAGEGTAKLSAASLALLAPDPKRSMTARLPGWHRGRSREREREAKPTPNVTAGSDAAPSSTNGVQPVKARNDGVQRAQTGGASTNAERALEEAWAQREARKARPAFLDADSEADADSVEGDGEAEAEAEEWEAQKVEKVELRRVGSVGRAARAVYVQARPAGAASRSSISLNGGGAGRGREGEPHPHPLRVLRLAVPRPLYEGTAGVGGGRVGRAVGRVLARGASTRSSTTGATSEQEGLALHLLFGPRVERRTLEKVLRTLGSGLAEVVPPAPSPVSTTAAVNGKGPQDAKGKDKKAPPSAWPARGRSGRVDPEPTEDTQPVTPVKPVRGVALLEVRSPVRGAELYKIVGTVLPSYAALRTLLLTRPQGQQANSISIPPSPRTPSSLSSPRTPSPSMRAPSSPSSRAPPSPRLRIPPSPVHAPPSPSTPLRAPPSPLLYPPPSPHSPSVRSSPSPTRTSPYSAPPSPTPTVRAHPTDPDAPWAWEWDGWGDAGDVLPALHSPSPGQPLGPPALLNLGLGAREKRLPELPVGDDEGALDGSFGDTSDLTLEDAAYVAAWRRRCEGLECVRMVSGAWWLRDGENE